MSLRDIDLKPEYVSLKDDVVGEFYLPVMRECVRFDRISCYFSPAALSRYCEGLYYLGKENRGKYRLIISSEVSEDTFRAIREGYNLQVITEEVTKRQMVDDLTLHDRVNLSNLSYMMACGIVEIKFGYCRDGLFHSKSGYVCDSQGNELCFTGSNNETRSSIEQNYEKFDITTTWLSSEFDRRRVSGAKNEFESMWRNEYGYVVVMDPPESFNKYLEDFNRGRLFRDEDEYTADALFLDYVDGAAVLTVPSDVVPSKLKFRIKVMSLVQECTDRQIRFHRDIGRKGLKNIHARLESYCTTNGRRLEVTSAFTNRAFASSRVEALAIRGEEIKRRSPALADDFHLFKETVDSNTRRKLRDEQMWDSFLLYTLSKAANFSVPGSGKTSTALGMFAYLRAMGSVRRMIVIGPLSSFDSWLNEFGEEFDGIIDWTYFRSDEHRGNLRYDYQFNSGNPDIVLFNYESFDRDTHLVRLVSGAVDDRTLLVFDEVHRIKKVGGERAKKMLEISSGARYAVVMTGTPIPNSYADAYNFLHVLFGQDDYDEYFGMSPSQLTALDGADRERFNSLMYPFFCRTTKDDLGVPPANEDIVVGVHASSEEEALLEVLKTRVYNPLEMIVRILQLESDPGMLNNALDAEDLGGMYEEPVTLGSEGLGIAVRTRVTEKTNACVDLVSNLVGEGKKVILWCIFRGSMDNLDRLLTERDISVCQVNGDTEDRSGAIGMFRDGRVDVLITNPQTLAEAVSLHDVCHDAVYFEYGYNLVHLLQSKDRIHRLGLGSGQYTQYHFLETIFVRDGECVSLDQKIHDRLNEKERIMLEAIENNEFEQFPSMMEEAQDILLEMGMVEVDRG